MINNLKVTPAKIDARMRQKDTIGRGGRKQRVEILHHHKIKIQGR
ncbi:MAG: hypothetical protein ACFFB0_13210 [Promethearchaeota archaeon]